MRKEVLNTFTRISANILNCYRIIGSEARGGDISDKDMRQPMDGHLTINFIVVL